MGPRKGGGGRAGFIKAARAKQEDTEEEVQQPEPPKAPEPAPAPAPSKAAAFLKDPEPAAASDSGDSDEDGEGGVETRGKMLQRHKREQKALKDKVKKLGKKGKEEAARLEAEMAARHTAELASIAGAKERTAAEAVAVADSLYAVHLAEGGEEGGQEGGHGKKPSKGQKRREQRQREEAEREARIAAELEALGDTDRVIEERELKAVLRPLGLGIRPIPPDGHCLYRSLEDQLQRLPEGVAPPPADAGEDEEDELNFLLLRQRAAAYMRAHADHFKPFVLEEDLAASAGGDDAFEAYCSELEGTAAWGGQVELQALAQALQSHIQVFSVGLPVLELGEEFKGTGRTLRLCYLRHAYGLGEHYESVVPSLVVAADEEEEEEEAAEEAAAAAAEAGAE
ncbi:OTU domain-containing 6B-like [Chlorella sorokiniana]|uniref:OTU domain-containing 6B-like n=1 Tax=Chlorella sorokiniana TaxID=3076 RepID=A0A2P6TZZ1_CHLSO|nr:OTU domain-containing 6B-like [Chlorella sorokiniana]|eukprot:PRW59631.1 OTU domain-containing 6B-like [Chlorella sorokiniana]